MEGQINIKVSLDIRGLHRDYRGETPAYPGRERDLSRSKVGGKRAEDRVGTVIYQP